MESIPIYSYNYIEFHSYNYRVDVSIIDSTTCLLRGINRDGGHFPIFQCFKCTTLRVLPRVLVLHVGSLDYCTGVIFARCGPILLHRDYFIHPPGMCENVVSPQSCRRSLLSNLRLFFFSPVFQSCALKSCSPWKGREVSYRYPWHQLDKMVRRSQRLGSGDTGEPTLERVEESSLFRIRLRPDQRY